MRLRVPFGVALVVGCGALACQSVTGLDDMEEGSETTDGGSPESGVNVDGSTRVDGSTDGGTPPSDASKDADAPAPGTLGGTVHFLGAGPLVLGMNAAVDGGGVTATVNANGSFTFPGTFGSSDAYDVTVVTQPANQRCWVANGKGTIGAGVGNVDVRCALALSSVGSATDQTTLSTSLVDMSDVAPITLTTDVASQALLTLSVPFVQGWNDGYAEYRLAIELDGAVVAESTYRTEKYTLVSQTPGFVSAVVPLPAGSHSVKARWRFVEYLYVAPAASDAIKRLAKVPAAGTAVPAELDVVVLDSLRAFDKVLESSSTTAVTASASEKQIDKPLGASLNVATPGQASLVMMRLPRITGADPYAKLFVDGAMTAYARRLRNDPSFSMATSFTPMIMLDGGSPTYAVTGAIGLINSSAALNGGGVCYGVTCLYDGGVADAGPLQDRDKATISALVWKNDAPSAYASSASPTTVGANGVTTYVSVKSTSINLTRPSKALVFMSASGLSVNATNEFGEVGVFAGATRTATAVEGHGPYADNLRAQGMTAVGIVDLPAGTTVLDLRARNANGVGATTVGTSYQINGAESFYGFGAIALE